MKVNNQRMNSLKWRKEKCEWVIDEIWNAEKEGRKGGKKEKRKMKIKVHRWQKEKIYKKIDEEEV